MSEVSEWQRAGGGGSGDGGAAQSSSSVVSCCSTVVLVLECETCKLLFVLLVVVVSWTAQYCTADHATCIGEMCTNHRTLHRADG